MAKFIFIFLVLSLVLSGCFEIREEVNMKSDGSGEVSFVVNLSQSKENVAKYMAMGSVEGYKVPSKQEVEANLAKIKASVGAVAGMSAVMVKSDWSSYIFTVSGRFAHVEALNKAMEIVAKEYDKEGKHAASGKSGFGYNNTQFKRFSSYPAKAKEFAALPSMQRYVLESAKMTSIYRFDRSIKKLGNPKAQLSPSGKAVMLTLPLSDLMKGTATVANTVSF
ncbi:MAG: hypothetical protein IT258_21070 [Saprospiraceae bacterium]|nr:hypothetical protein [Saprospiraceae bacterium]